MGYKRANLTSKLGIVGCTALLCCQQPVWAETKAEDVAAAKTAAAKGDEGDLPKGLDDLFGLDDAKPAASATSSDAAAAKAGQADLPKGVDDLFGLDDPKTAAKAPSSAVVAAEPGLPIRGFVQFEAARTVADPEHWSKLRTRAELGSKGVLGNGVKWYANVRLDYDAVFAVEDDFYPAAMADDQRFEASIRETYLDIGAGDWDFRLGRQHVVWGEMVGLFFADVVSARDLREFILPEFDVMRIPQWAARAEYYKDDFHAELLWIPAASYDDIGKPGAEFYPLPENFSVLKEDLPAHSLDHTNYGLRLSTLKNGWDLSGFYYGSMDREPTFYRHFEGLTPVYRARHDRIHQFGGTVSKDFRAFVLKGEATYTNGRSFPVWQDAGDADGVVEQDILDWAIGFDFTLPSDTRFNVQFFQRAFFDHDARIPQDEYENGYSLYLNKKLSDRLEAQVIWLSSLNRTDWLLRPRVSWDFERNWRLLVGADVFQGKSMGLFGQYDPNDRVYAEVRYSF